MPASPGTTQKNSDPTGQDEAAQNMSAGVERPATGRRQELQAEIEALRRENAELKRANNECKNLEEALREEKERAGSILSALDTAQSLVDRDMTIVWVNQKARDLLPGQGEPVGQKCYRLYEGMNAPCEVCAARHTFATGEVTRVEKYVAERGRWYDIIAQPIKDASGQVVQSLESFTDITDRKKAEEALHESAEGIEMVLNSIIERFFRLDKDWRYTHFNKQARQQLIDLGKNPDELIGKVLWEEFPNPPVEEDFRRAMLERVPLVHETYYPPLGEWVENRIYPTADGGLTVFQRDITERKRAEQALWESEERFRRAIEDAPIPIIMYVEDGEVLQISRSWTELTGYTLQDVPTFDAWLTDAYGGGADAVRDHMQGLFKGDQRTIGIEFPIRTRDGQTRHWSFSASSPGTLADGRRFIVGMAVDITDRKRAEEGLVHRTEDLVRLNRDVEAARDEANMYLDIMTHDVRNANNVSSMYADLLVELLAGDQWLYARKLRDSIGRSSEILKNVTTIRRLQQESGCLMPVNIDAVIKEEIGNFPGASIRNDGHRVEVLVDGLIQTVFNNLIGNAVKYGGPDVEIMVRVEEQDGEVLVSVEDTGPGVPDEMKAKLFHRFERGIQRGKGEGLGLYICRTLVTRYGGRIWVEDRVPGFPEEGAAFRFTLRKAG